MVNFDKWSSEEDVRKLMRSRVRGVCRCKRVRVEGREGVGGLGLRAPEEGDVCINNEMNTNEGLRVGGPRGVRAVKQEQLSAISEDQIEAFELQNPDVVLTTPWRIRKHLWAMVFGTRWFHKIIKETETDVDLEFSVLDTLLYNRLYQIIELTKNNNEETYDEFYPFTVVMMNFLQLIPLFRFIYKNSSFTKEGLELD